MRLISIHYDVILHKWKVTYADDNKQVKSVPFTTESLAEQFGLAIEDSNEQDDF